MDSNLQTKDEPGLASLLTGIVNDAQELFRQQLVLFRREVAEDFEKTRAAGVVLLAGAGVAMVGGILLCLALVYLLNWAAPNLPLWACYAIVGGVGTVLGVILIYQAKAQFASFNPLPDKTADALRENLQWKTPK